MAIQLIAGQTFANDYSLLQPLDSRQNWWLAQHEPTQERVRLILLPDASETDLQAIQNRIERYQPLLHPNLLRVYRAARHEDTCFAVAEYRKGLSNLDLDRPRTASWPALKTIMESLDYIHSLGFYHGNLSPACLWTDSTGTPYVDGFGLTTGEPQAVYLAPEVAAGQSASSLSDIYGMAQILHRVLTGSPWSGEANLPVDDSIAEFLSAMLTNEPSQRPADFVTLIRLMDEAGSDEHEAVSVAAFDRAAPAAPLEANDTMASAQHHKLPRDRSVVSMPVALLGLAILLTVAFGLFFLLPDPEVQRTASAASNAPPVPTASESETPANAPTATPEASLAPLELARRNAMRQRGEELAAELLRRQVEVEDVGGRLWAGNRYDESTQLGIEGDEAYRDDELALAIEKYNEGVTLLGEVLAESDVVFDENLERGALALQTGDAEAAIEAYRIVTRIEPEDPSLAADLDRALNLEQVIRLSSEAGVMERNGNLLDALKTFREASALDPAWQPAAEGVQRVNNRIARRQFQDAMSRGFAALNSNDFEAARTAFEEAEAILPNSTEPADGLQQIELARTQKQIQDLTEQANSLMEASQWDQAIPLFEDILTITPGLTTAEASLQQARERAELQRVLDKYLEQPQLMQNDDELATARTALLQAARLDLDSMADEVRDLSHLVSLARVPVTVILQSDNRTEVTVYQVQQFGKISETRLSLIPGVYTFVGKRQGYRDVYKEVHIKGDRNPVTVEIRASERI